MPVTTVRTDAEVNALATGTEFSIRLAKTLSHKDLNGIFYRTANRQVTLTLRDGSKITGTLNETPGYFAEQRLWLRVPGRKTRKGVNLRDIQHLRGFKAPTLAEAYTALIGLTSSNPSPELLAESRRTAALM